MMLRWLCAVAACQLASSPALEETTTTLQTSSTTTQFCADFAGEWTNYQHWYSENLLFSQTGCSGTNEDSVGGHAKIAWTTFTVTNATTIVWDPSLSAQLDTNWRFLDFMVFNDASATWERQKECSVANCLACSETGVCVLCGNDEYLTSDARCTEVCGGGQQKTNEGPHGGSCEVTVDPQANICGAGYTRQSGELLSFGYCPNTTTPQECVLQQHAAKALCDSSPLCSGVSNDDSLGNGGLLKLGRATFQPGTAGGWMNCQKENQYCLRATTIQTGGASLRVEENGVIEDEFIGTFVAGTVVIDKCYTKIIQLHTSGQGADAWIGKIEFSFDGGRIYIPMICPSCGRFTVTKEYSTSTALVGTNPDYSWMATSGNPGVFGSETRVLKPPGFTDFRHCVRILSTGMVGVSADIDVYWLGDSGAWLIEDWPETSPPYYTEGDIVLEKCYSSVPLMRIESKTNEWSGEVLYSADHRLTYSPMLCIDCDIQAIDYALVASNEICSDIQADTTTRYVVSSVACEFDCPAPKSCDLDCCKALCDSFAWCTHLTWFIDNACRLYDRCSTPVACPPQLNSSIYHKVSGRAQSVVIESASAGALSAPTKCLRGRRCQFNASTLGTGSFIHLPLDSYLQCMFDPIPADGAGTVCVWAKWTSFKASGQYMIAAGGQTPVSYGHTSGFSASGEFIVQLVFSNRQGLKTQVDFNGMPTNTWTSVCYTWDRADPSLRIYVNGANTAGTATLDTIGGTPRKDSPGLTINTRNDAPGRGSGAASYDDISLWDRRLTNDEIVAVHSRRDALDFLSFFSDCKAWWRFNGDLSDSSQNGNYHLFGLPGTSAVYRSDREYNVSAVTTVTTTAAITTLSATATVASEHKAQKMRGEMKVSVSNPERFVQEPNVERVFRTVIAKLYEIEENEQWVQNVSVEYIPPTRRLVVKRLLLSDDIGDIDVDWEIVIPPGQEDTVVVEILAEKFDSKTMSEATQSINALINAGLLGQGYDVNVTWKYTIVEKEEAPIESEQEDSSAIIIVVIVIAACGVISAVSLIAIVLFKYRVSREKELEKNPFARLGLLSEKAKKGKKKAKNKGAGSGDYTLDSLLQSPESFAAITAAEGRRLRDFVQEFAGHLSRGSAANVFITYTCGQRPEDAQGYGPASYYAAAIVKHLADNNIDCFCDLMLPDDIATRKIFCGQIGGVKSAVGQTLIVLQTAALYDDKFSLREIYSAQSSKFEIIPLRFESHLPSGKDVWPQITRNDMEGMLMVSSVVERFCKLNSIPSPPWTIINQRSVLEDFTTDLKLKKQAEVLCIGNQEPAPEKVGAGGDTSKCGGSTSPSSLHKTNSSATATTITSEPGARHGSVIDAISMCTIASYSSTVDDDSSRTVQSITSSKSTKSPKRGDPAQKGRRKRSDGIQQATSAPVPLNEVSKIGHLDRSATFDAAPSDKSSGRKRPKNVNSDPLNSIKPTRSLPEYARPPKPTAKRKVVI